MTAKRSVGQALGELTDSRFLTQAEIAEATGVKDPSISALFSGKTDLPTSSVAYKIARILGVSLDEVMAGLGERKASDEADAVAARRAVAGFLRWPTDVRLASALRALMRLLERNDGQYAEKERNIGLVLRDVAKSKGLSRIEVARASGVAEGYVMRLLRGKMADPGAVQVHKVCRVLGLTVDEAVAMCRQDNDADTEKESRLS